MLQIKSKWKKYITGKKQNTTNGRIFSYPGAVLLSQLIIFLIVNAGWLKRAKLLNRLPLLEREREDIIFGQTLPNS